MARKLRVQYPGAIYHVMNRGDHLEVIFRDERDPELFMCTLEEGCLKADWQVHSARQAAVSLTLTTQENNPLGSLLLDILLLFTELKSDRLFSQTLVQELNRFSSRPWIESRNGKPITDLWLAHQLRPYGIRPRHLRIMAPGQRLSARRNDGCLPPLHPQIGNQSPPHRSQRTRHPRIQFVAASGRQARTHHVT